MAKYYLVASYYNIYTGQYENETTINLDKINLSTLQQIDLFTSSHTKDEILKIIEENLNIKGLNHLAIKYYKNKNANPEPFRVIENNPEYKETIKELNNIEYWLPNGKIYATGIENKEAPLYVKEKDNLEKFIKNKDLASFNEIYKRNDNLKFLVNRYLTTNYGEPNQETRDYNLIFKEFSNYITFRNWIIAKEKYKERQKNNNRPVNNRQPINNQQRKKTTKPKKVEKKSIEEREEEYITDLAKKIKEKFEAENKDKPTKEISKEYVREEIIKQMLQDTNNQTDEYEEFLDEEEVAQMLNEGIYDSYEETYQTNRQIRR